MIYSPSMTETWKFCPLKSFYQKVEQLEPKKSRTLVARLGGTAIAEGLSIIHSDWYTHNTSTISAPYIIAQAKERATKYLSLASTHYQVCGCEVDPVSVERKILEVQRAIEKYAKAKPLAGFTITDVEKELTQYGRCRIDLGLLTPGNDYAIADVKFKGTLDDKYREGTITDYLNSWQFNHYAWAYAKTIQKPVPLKYLILIVNTPFRIDVIPQEVEPEWMKVWEQTATQAWADMDAERANTRPLTTSAIHRDVYGRCEFEKLCMDYKLDVDRGLEQDYVRVPAFDFALALTREGPSV